MLHLHRLRLGSGALAVALASTLLTPGSRAQVPAAPSTPLPPAPTPLPFGLQDPPVPEAHQRARAGELQAWDAMRRGRYQEAQRLLEEATAPVLMSAGRQEDRVRASLMETRALFSLIFPGWVPVLGAEDAQDAGINRQGRGDALDEVATDLLLAQALLSAFQPLPEPPPSDPTRARDLVQQARRRLEALEDAPARAWGFTREQLLGAAGELEAAAYLGTELYRDGELAARRALAFYQARLPEGAYERVAARELVHQCLDLQGRGFEVSQAERRDQRAARERLLRDDPPEGQPPRDGFLRMLAFARPMLRLRLDQVDQVNAAGAARP